MHAVDATAHSQGLVAQLLRFVLKLAIKMSREVGCAGVVVDAKPSAIDFYANYGFTRPLAWFFSDSARVSNPRTA